MYGVYLSRLLLVSFLSLTFHQAILYNLPLITHYQSTLHFSTAMQNFDDTQEPVASQTRSDETDNAKGIAKSGRPSQEETSLRAKLSEFEEVCQSALEQQTMQEVRERYKAILRQANSNKDDIAEQQDLVGTNGGQAKSLDDGKESQDLGLALLDAGTLFNDTSDLMKANVLEAFQNDLTTINKMPQSAAAHYLRDVADKFAFHASALNGPAVELIRLGRDDDSFEWLYGIQADRFIRQSHFAFQKSLQELNAELNIISADQGSRKSLTAALADLSRLGDDVLHATLVRLKDEEKFQIAPMSKTASITMLKSQYCAMQEDYDRAQENASVERTASRSEGVEGETAARRSL
jgi:hypothetical protein